MKLKVLSQHYKNVGSKWVPKKAFVTKEEIKIELGYDPDSCIVYRCIICNFLHTSTKVNENLRNRV